MILRIGSYGQAVTRLQMILKRHGFAVNVDGQFGTQTDKIVRQFQAKHNLLPDGIVGPKTWSRLEPKPTHNVGSPNPGLWEDLWLESHEYFTSLHPKVQIVLHHTAGGGSVDATRSWWENDTQRVATAFVIGGYDRDPNQDGRIVRVFDEKYWAWHLGTRNQNLNKISIGIEICNYGFLKKNRQGQYVTWANNILPPDQVCDLGYNWRGLRYFQRYTPKQIAATVKLVHYLSRTFNIPTNNTDYSLASGWFDISPAALQGQPGIWNHTNYRRDKTDIFPQPDMIAALQQSLLR